MSRCPDAVRTVILSPVNELLRTYLLCTIVLIQPESTTISAAFPLIFPLTLHGGKSGCFDSRVVMHSK